MPISRDVKNEQQTNILQQTTRWLTRVLMGYELMHHNTPIDMDILYDEVRDKAQKDNKCSPAWCTFVVVAEQTKHIVQMDKSGMVGTLTIKKEEE